MNDKAQRKVVSKFLLDQFKVTNRVIPEIANRQTPDFELYHNGKQIGFGEIKSLNDPWLDSLLDDAQPFEIVGGNRNDPTFNRIANAIYKASKQFESINQNHNYPNILILLNYDEASNVGDLYSTVTGNFFASDGSQHPIYKSISEGRIRETKNIIELFIWINIVNGKVCSHNILVTHESILPLNKNLDGIFYSSKSIKTLQYK
jgi:hypothetical protein